ncbi:hypothetical protein PHMEG_00032580 [Phytophthora megakarya]|uniref:Uncharacterized protein n=1 Tax=Phytophthora megakarya TaxID=4795 RepID=A0A225UXM2_9STRA|nr:hypothetical protein PHMEG_00032580 [Phytophthora megakarya]
MSGRYAVDSDGDVEMSIPQPIFEVIRPPELSSWEHAALIEWDREWQRYVEKIRHRCSTTGETFENVVATVKGSVKPKTLKNMATYVLKKPVASVTDGDIMTAVQARCRTLKNEFVPDVTSLFRQKLKMDLTVDDCDARVFRYYEDFNGIVEDNGLQGLIGTGSESEDGYKSRLKARCRLLVKNLQPPVLKAQISRLIDLERRDCKSDDVSLFDLILKHAKVQQRFHRMSQDYATRGDSRLAKSERKPQRADSIKGCLVCKGPHWLKDCPTATGAQREEAQRKFREAKEQRLSALRSKSARYATPAGTVRVNGLLEMPYIPDTGADKSIVPQNIMDSLLAVQPTLVVTPLNTQVEAEMADGRKVFCDKEILLNLELSTVAGMVSMRSVPCLILPGDGDEFLLGRDALKELGIDVERQLAQLAGQTTLATDVDEFPVGDALPEGQEVHTVDDDAKQLVAQAVANGMPAQYVAAVRRILADFPDVWRTTIGPDPPALVEPLRVTLQVDAVPHRSPPRQQCISLGECRGAG